jgi:sugar lactone lactonase YvrE
MTPELYLDARATLGEGPVWLDGALTWVDILEKKVHITRDGQDQFLQLDDKPGCIVPRKSGGYVLAAARSFLTLDAGSGKSTVIASPDPDPGNRFNDGKCDPRGRLLAGTMDDAEQRDSGSLYSLAPGGTVTHLFSGVRISNGLAWSADGHSFYHIDTPTRFVTAYDYDLDDGALSNPRKVIHVPEELGWPDGMAIDARGQLWIALWGGSALSVWDPATGSLIRRVPVPALNVTSCAFGGSNGDELFVTSARVRTDEQALQKFPHAGGVFHFKPGVDGPPPAVFAG